MAKKHKKNHRQTDSAVTPPWWKRAWAIVTLIPLGAIVGIVGLAFNYKTSDAVELRTLVYEPLYTDLVKVEGFLLSMDIQALPADKRPVLLSGIKVALKDRVREPKQICDLINLPGL